jgi:hypothetical protein
VYGTKKLIIDVCGKYEKFSVLDDQDGDDVITATLRAGYDATAALFAKFVIVNELATIP